jgi:site-specific DNA recombinase
MRAAKVARIRADQAAVRDPKQWAGQTAAIYCRISKADDDDQTGVDRQEAICKELAGRLDLMVAPDLVFKDPNRSAWKRDRKRPGWDDLLESITSGRVSHVIAYHPDRIMRQPADLEELLRLSDEHHVTLHGNAGGRDLTDPDDRFILRIEVAHACRSSDDTSRRIKSKFEERAAAGLPHIGRRRYGYDTTGNVIEDEAEIVKEIFAEFLDGKKSRTHALELRERGLKTANGAEWNADTIVGILRSHFVAGIRVFRGEAIGPGAWPAIIDPGTYYEVQERLDFRAVQWREGQSRHYYLLRGLVRCGKCGRRMTGTATTSKTGSYQCSRARAYPDGDKKRCARRVNATFLESFVRDAVLDLLEKLDLSGRQIAEKMTPQEANDAATDRQQLEDLKRMWITRQITTAEYESMQRDLKAEIAKRLDKAVVRPAVQVLQGLTGPQARKTWKELEDDEQYDRINAIFRFLIDSVVIGENSTRGVADYSRIKIEPRDL